jgi:excisionase family DNA binding protein
MEHGYSHQVLHQVPPGDFHTFSTFRIQTSLARGTNVPLPPGSTRFPPGEFLRKFYVRLPRNQEEPRSGHQVRTRFSLGEFLRKFYVGIPEPSAHQVRARFQSTRLNFYESSPFGIPEPGSHKWKPRSPSGRTRFQQGRTVNARIGHVGAESLTHFPAVLPGIHLTKNIWGLNRDKLFRIWEGICNLFRSGDIMQDSNKQGSSGFEPSGENRKWLTPAEAAEYLRIETRTVLSWARQGKLKAYTLSGTKRRVWRFLSIDLDAMMRQPSVLSERRLI